ncbi:MAG: ion transporter [Ardenticatenaceae bacterium]
MSDGKANEKSQKKLSFIDALILILSIYVIIQLIVEELVPLSPQVLKVLAIVDTAICFVFLADFFIRLWRSEDKKTFLKWNWIDFISSIPMLEAFRVGRFVRVMRVFRLLRGARSAKMLLAFAFKNRKRSVPLSVATMSIVLLIWAAVSVLAVEVTPESNITNASDALWWSFVTMTTVGYGDLYPVTLEGRLIAAVLMAAGIGLLGTLTALMTSFFVDGSEDEIDLWQNHMIESLNQINQRLQAIEQELQSLREKEK